jgi:hypothetical protein
MTIIRFALLLLLSSTPSAEIHLIYEAYLRDL